MTDTVNVPREPTRKMVMSGASACEYEIGPAKIKATYRAMLAAAPKADTGVRVLEADKGWAIEPICTHPAPSSDELLEALRRESWDLRCFNIPTGGDDYDIGWRVVGHWQADPNERTIAEVYTDDPAAAVRAAIAKHKGPQ